MKSLRLHIILCFLLACFASFAQLPQNLRHSSELFLIEKGTNVKVIGGLESVTGNSSNSILNQGNIYVSDSIVNNGGVYIFGDLPDTLGHVYLDGSSNQKFSGNAIYFSNLTLNNAEDTLFIHNDTVYITKKLFFQKGKVDLGGGVLHLKRTSYAWGTQEGELDQEDSTSYVFGAPGYIKMYRPLSLGSSYNNLHKAGFGLTVNGNLGTRTEIRRYHKVESKPSNGSIERQFRFYPQNTDFVSDLKMNYIDTNGLRGNSPRQLAVFNSTNNGSNWKKETSSVDTVLNQVSSTGLVSLSTASIVTLAEGECDVLPPVSFRQDTFALCSGKSIYLAPDSIGNSETAWSTSVSNVDSIQVTSPGKFWIEVQNESGCTNSDTCVVVNAPDPLPGFFAAPHCLGDSAFFNDTSSIASGSLSYKWDFGDPFSNSDTSSLKLPKYVYSKFGTYPARVTVTSDYGCVKSISRSVVILPAPDAQFSVNDTCVDSIVVFNNTTTVPGSAGISYSWRFGDGDTSILSQPIHSYSQDTSFRVKLLASSNGCEDSSFKTVNIYPNPTAKFVFRNACPSELVEVTDSSKISKGTLVYNYNLGNGVISSQSNPNATYTSAGQYIISLDIVSNRGCRSNFRDTISIHPIPSAVFTTSNACLDDSVGFVNSSSVSSGTFSSFWKFGDGDTLSANQVKHKYANTGQFTARLKVTSDSGCVDSISQAVNIFPKPKAAFTFSKACEGDAVSFVNSSIIGAGSLNYKWYFGNGDTSTLNAPQTVYPTSGLRNILLVASSNQGCSDSLTKSVSVQAKPIVSLGTVINTCGSSLVLNAGNSGSNFLWSNGKNTQAITALNSGNFWVKVTNAAGCEALDTVNVQLNSNVQPQLGIDRSVCDSILLTSGYGSTASTALWNTASTSHSLSVKASGVYWVQVTDPNNCIGRDTVNITVNTSPVLNLGADIVACADSVITLSSNVSVSNYKWSTGAITPQVSPTVSGNYKLTVTDVNGCKDDDDVLVTFNRVPVFSLGADLEVCDSVQLNMNVADATLSWKGGSSGNQFIVSLTDQVWATATAGTGCDYSDTINVLVHTSPIVNLGKDTILCNGDSLQIESNFNIGKYKWNTGDTTEAVLLKYSKKLNLQYTDTHQCKGYDTINVVINPAFNVDLGADVTLCSNAKKLVNPGIKNASFIWGGGQNFNSTDPYVSLNDTGTYWVEVKDSVGCVSSDTIRLLYTPKQANADFLSAKEIFTGDTAAFINLSNPKPDSQLWMLHDGFTSTQQHLVHPYFQQGNYAVKLVVYNSVCTDTLNKTIMVKLRTRNDVYEEADLTTFNQVESLKLYPNPTRSYLNVEFEMTEEGDAIIEMFNMQGRLISVKRLNGQKFLEQYELTDEQSGMYFIRVATGRSSKVAKFIKVN